MTKKLLLIIALILTGMHISMAAEATATDSITPVKTSGFTWGADLGAAMDIDGHDMAQINVNAYAGWKFKAFPLIGVGAGIDMALSNNSHMFPVYAIVRTNFGKHNSLLFGELRGGISINSVGNDYQQADAYISPGVGMNLAVGNKYHSYLVVSYVYNDLRYNGNGNNIGRITGLNYANVCLGITF